MLLDRMRSEVEMTLRHLVVLKTVKENEPIGIFKLSELLKLPNHKVRYSLRILEQSGLIRPSPQGAVVTERYDEFKGRIENELEKVLEALNEIRSISEEIKEL
jgi:predicted transcriptional regulator